MFIRNVSDCKECNGGDRSLLRELLHPDKADLTINYSFAHATVKPGTKTLPHTLTSAEVYYILDGSGTVHVASESAAVRQNDAIYIPPHAVEYIQNSGTKDLTFICIVDPAWKKEDEKIL